MPFRDDDAALRHRIEAAEGELTELRAAIRECEAVLAARLREGRVEAEREYSILRPTHDPDIRWVRAWESKMQIIPFGLAAFAIGVTVSGASVWGGLFLGLFGAFILQIPSRRALFNRQTRTYDVRLPWSPRAHEATRPFAPEHVVVRLRHDTARNSTQVYYSVEIRDVGVAEGMGEDEANTLANEIRDFVGSAPAPMPRERRT